MQTGTCSCALFLSRKELILKQGYLNSLTWLRALAAFFVVVSHSIRTAEVKYSDFDEESYFLPISLLDLGTFGVYLFFALSGCTLYLSNGNKFETKYSYYNFIIKRFLRIWPAFAVSMVMYILFIEVFRAYYTADHSLWIAQFLRDYTIVDVIYYLSLMFNLTGPQGLFQSPYWSLPVEFQYYLMFPLCVFFMSSRWGSLFFPCLFGGVLYLIYIEEMVAVDRFDVFKMGFSFFGGMLLAVVYKAHALKIKSIYGIVFFLFLVFLVSLVRMGALVVPAYIPFISDTWNFYGICALISVFIALNMEPVRRENFVTRFLSEYGEISYSIYLFHMIFVGLAALLVVNFQIYGDSPKLFFVLIFSLYGSYIFSKLTYKLVELPSISLGRKLSKPFKSI